MSIKCSIYFQRFSSLYYGRKTVLFYVIFIFLLRYLLGLGRTERAAGERIGSDQKDHCHPWSLQKARFLSLSPTDFFFLQFESERFRESKGPVFLSGYRKKRPSSFIIIYHQLLSLSTTYHKKEKERVVYSRLVAAISNRRQLCI